MVADNPKVQAKSIQNIHRLIIKRVKLMTIEQIREGLIESRESFTQSIRHTYIGYQETIDAVSKIPAIVKFLEKEFPGQRLAAEWNPDPECYEASSIFIEIYFPNSEEHKEIKDKIKNIYPKYIQLFPIASRSIILSMKRDGLNE